jgi:hypothetical protein
MIKSELAGNLFTLHETELDVKCGSYKRKPLAQKTASLIKEKKLMNVEHQTSNIGHRIMYSVCLIRTERSVSTIRQSTFVIPL